MSPNAKAAFDFFVAKGLTDFQAAGVVGNLIAESGLNPLISGREAGGYYAHGIAQWGPPRWAALQTWAAGQDPNTLAVQLGFVWRELTTNASLGLADLRAATTVDAASIAFEKKYERPAAGSTARRIALAKEVLAAFGGPQIQAESSTGSRVFWTLVFPVTVFAGGYWYAVKQRWVRPVPGLRWRA